MKAGMSAVRLIMVRYDHLSQFEVHSIADPPLTRHMSPVL